MPRVVDRIELAGPAGRIEGLLHRPEAAARFVAVVAHPHPLHGGTMDSKVVYRVARALEATGGLVLRFNFRGVGRSEGEHDRGRGEQDDLRAALAHVRAQGGPGLPVVLAGFSFGSLMAAAVAAEDPDVAALILVGLPLASTPREKLEPLRRLRLPVAIVQGDRDEHGPLDGVRAMQDELEAPSILHVIEGADHFFEGHQDELGAAVQELVTSGALGPLGARR